MKEELAAEVRPAEPGAGMKVLILSKTLQEKGGVVNFVAMLLNRVSSDFDLEHLEIGRNSSERNLLGKLVIHLMDSVGLIRKLLSGGYGTFQLNTSLNWRSLFRDASFLLLASWFGYDRGIVFIHGWDESCEQAIRKRLLGRYLFVRVFGRARRLIVLASRFRDALVSMGIEPDKVRVFSTMFDGELFEGTHGKRNAEPETLLFMSRLVREKGVFELLEAFLQLRGRYHRLRLDIAGDGEERLGVTQWVDAHGLRDRVRLLGYLRGEEKARALLGADIFVLPTRHGEGCPVTLLEAMAAGLAVITTPVGGIPDVFSDGVNGILLRDHQPATIAEAIGRLLDDGELCARTGEYNRGEAWKRFESRIVACRMEQLYREVAAAS